MTEQIKQPFVVADKLPIPQDPFMITEKIHIKDIDFDNVTEEELNEIKEEIEIVIKIRSLKNERMEQIKKQIQEEKEELRKKMLKEIKKEKERLKEQEETEEVSESDESIVYDSKTPKGRATKTKSKPRGRPPAKKK